MNDAVTLAQEILAHSERAVSAEDGGYVMRAYQAKAAWHFRDIARALLAAHERIKELEAKQSWRPIESAPRDRESLDLWVCDDAGGYRITNCHWLAERGWVYFDDGAFLEVATDADQFISHWMPLPESPK